MTKEPSLTLAQEIYAKAAKLGADEWELADLLLRCKSALEQCERDKDQLRDELNGITNAGRAACRLVTKLSEALAGMKLMPPLPQARRRNR